MVDQEFQDHFSSRSKGYASFRPRYPTALYEWLAGQCRARGTAWDCATGSGQAAIGLSPFFQRVIATDASRAQIDNATPAPNVEYRVAAAEESGLADRSVDLVTVAQSLHWVDRDRFFAEAARVAKPGSPLAVWMYNLMEVAPAIDRVIRRLYSEVLSGFWPSDRALVDDDYRSIGFPFPEVAAPRFEMTAEWPLDHLLGYLRTWSGVIRYVSARGEDPVHAVEPELTKAWGDRGESRVVRWPLVLRVARVG